MTVWLFYDDSLKYSRVVVEDKYMGIDVWTNDEDLYDMRCDIFKSKGKIDCIDMNKDEFSKFCRSYSDKALVDYSLMVGRSAPSNNVDDIFRIQVPLSRDEYYEIHDAYDKYISTHSEMVMPPDIFKKKYAKALRVLGMEILYSSLMTSEDLEAFNNSDFAINNNILYETDSFYDSYYMEPNEFSYFMLIYGKFLKKEFFEKYMKG